MRILFDQGTPVPLRGLLSSHQVETAFERGWSTLRNSDLLAAAEREGFEVFVTTDKNLRNQQNFAGLRIAIVVLTSTSWPRIQKAATAVKQAIDAALLEFQGSGDPVRSANNRLDTDTCGAGQSAFGFST